MTSQPHITTIIQYVTVEERIERERERERLYLDFIEKNWPNLPTRLRFARDLWRFTNVL